ncbi:MAG TPA: ribosome maturation factor RimM [Casimicrobiaceae bacterium]|nr:ribosome maturation factor RimM [Casimicrobiaceae bacterium]
MGQVLATYGVRGWLKVRSFTSRPAALLEHRAWWLGKDASWREFAVRESRLHAGAIVAELDGLQAREDAMRWRGAEIAVPRAALPPLSAGEFYLADLTGLAVVNRQAATLGRVVGLIETGAHPVLRVAGEATGTPERLIPLVPAFVDRIDLDAARIEVDWPAES